MGLLRQGPGDEDTLPLAAGQLRDQRGAAVPHVHALQAEAHRLLVALAGAPQPADVVLAAHHDHVVHRGGEGPVDAVALGDVGEGALRRRRAAAGDSAPGDGQDARDGVEEGALAGAVGAHNAHQRARTDVEVDVDQRLVAAPLDVRGPRP